MKDLKQKVFALYWGQKIVYNNLFKFDDLIEVCSASFSPEALPHLHLEVTPISMITDEHAIEVAKMFDIAHLQSLSVLKHLVFTVLSDFSTKQGNVGRWLNVIDFLRSKGYALPAFGHSVEQIVELGIFKLKES